MVRLSANSYLIWKDFLAYVMTYDIPQQSFTFEKYPKHPQNLLGFAFVKIQEYVLTFGGLNVKTWKRTNEIWVLTLKTSKWKRCERVRLPIRVWNSCAVLSSDGKKVHMVGGVDDDGRNQNIHWIMNVVDLLPKEARQVEARLD